MSSETYWSRKSPFLLVFAVAIGGCSRSPLDLVPVTGTVKYEDGTVPGGEMRVLSFEPTGGWQGKFGPRVATATLNDDGSYAAMTLRPADGIVPGEYKVVLLFFKSRIKHEPVLPDEYGQLAKTPLPLVTVKPGEKNHFDFVVQRRASH